jgi:hypothetical protein
MKMEQKIASADASVNGVLKATQTEKLSRAPMQPMAYAYGSSHTTYVRFCEAYNT